MVLLLKKGNFTIYRLFRRKFAFGQQCPIAKASLRRLQVPLHLRRCGNLLQHTLGDVRSVDQPRAYAVCLWSSDSWRPRPDPGNAGRRRRSRYLPGGWQ